ncbi:MAG TPA: hypothetical protein VIF57_29345 [Polyangia bacterium]
MTHAAVLCALFLTSEINSGGSHNIIVSETGGNVTVDTGNHTTNNTVNNIVTNVFKKTVNGGPRKYDAKDKEFFLGLMKSSLEGFFKEREESGQSKDKELDGAAVARLEETVEKNLEAGVRSEAAMQKLTARADHSDEHFNALIAELNDLRAHYRVLDQQRRLDEESWRTNRGWGLTLSPTVGFGQDTVYASVGGSVQVLWAGPALAALSRWSRAVRPIAGISVGYASMWREKQSIAGPYALGTTRENLYGAGAVAGMLLQWERWSLSGETELRTRPFAGLGLRWSVGAYGAMHLARSPWWVRLGASAAPVDTGAAVEDSAYDPIGDSTPYTSHVPSPRLEATVGVMALLY